MTVIAGVASNYGKKGVVIGSDRLVSSGDFNIAEYIRYLELDDIFGVSDFIEYLKKINLDKIKITLRRKIQISKDKQSVLTGTGAINETNKKATQLLLHPKTFLKDNSFLKKMLFPFELPEGVQKKALNHFKSTFDLAKRIREAYSPEIRRIADIQVVQRHEIDVPGFKKSYWDRDYNPRLSEHIMATFMKHKGEQVPLLLDISNTGTIHRCEYYANGAGQEYALEYMRERLGTGKPLITGENQVRKQVTLEEAENVVKEAISHANEKSLLCRGLDYVILTEKGIETHFSDERGEYEINLIALINSRLKNINQEVIYLKKAKKEYQKIPDS